MTTRCRCVHYEWCADEDWVSCVCGHSPEEHTPECHGEVDFTDDYQDEEENR